jgi:hypothetical protein
VAVRGYPELTPVTLKLLKHVTLRSNDLNREHACLVCKEGIRCIIPGSEDTTDMSKLKRVNCNDGDIPLFFHSHPSDRRDKFQFHEYFSDGDYRWIRKNGFKRYCIGYLKDKEPFLKCASKVPPEDDIKGMDIAISIANMQGLKRSSANMILEVSRKLERKAGVRKILLK